MCVRESKQYAMLVSDSWPQSEWMAARCESIESPCLASAMPLRTVSETCPPRRTAPANSKIAARTTA